VTIYHPVPTNSFLGEQERFLTTFGVHIPPNDVPRTTQAFLRYYTRWGPFREDHSSWGYAEDPVTFWQLHFDDNNALSELADRVLHAISKFGALRASF
jgi:hypothetical protein